jgi:hypothetical protein
VIHKGVRFGGVCDELFVFAERASDGADIVDLSSGAWRAARRRPLVVSSTVYFIRHGLQWKDAPKRLTENAVE